MIITSEVINVREHIRVHCSDKGLFTLCDCDCDFSYLNKWVVQDSMEVLTLCDCDNITNYYSVHCKQNQIAYSTVWTGLKSPFSLLLFPSPFDENENWSNCSLLEEIIKSVSEY